MRQGSEEDLRSRTLFNGRYVKLGIGNTKQIVIFLFYLKLDLDPKSGERIFSFSPMPPTVLAGAIAKDNSTVFRALHFQYHHLSHFRPRAASGKSTILAAYQSYGSTVMIGLQRMM